MTETIDPGEIGKREGMARSEGGVDVRTMAIIHNAIEHCARTMRTFTSEDVKPLVAHLEPSKWQCLGGAFRWAAHRGLVTKTGQFKSSNNAICHKRPQMIWASKVFEGTP